MNIAPSLYQDDLARLGRDLRAAREAAGLTQDNVAAQLGVSRSTVTKIERGAWNVTVGYLIAMAKLYGARLDLNSPFLKVV